NGEERRAVFSLRLQGPIQHSCSPQPGPGSPSRDGYDDRLHRTRTGRTYRGPLVEQLFQRLALHRRALDHSDRMDVEPSRDEDENVKENESQYRWPTEA